MKADYKYFNQTSLVKGLFLSMPQSIHIHAFLIITFTLAKLRINTMPKSPFYYIFPLGMIFIYFFFLGAEERILFINKMFHIYLMGQFNKYP